MKKLKRFASSRALTAIHFLYTKLKYKMFAHKTVLITGASSGIGRHAAAVFASHGAQVAVCARRKDQLDLLVDELPTKALSVELDVSQEASISCAIEKVRQEFGSIDILINNAGIAVDKRSTDTTLSDFDAVMNVNVRGPMLMSNAIASDWIRLKRPGCIINIGSIAGLHGSPQLALYGASKSALHHLTRSQAVEWAKFHINVNAIAPGYIKTEMNQEFFDHSPMAEQMIQKIPQKRLGKVSDLDQLLLLLSTQSSYLTGAVIPIDGGHSCGSFL